MKIKGNFAIKIFGEDIVAVAEGEFQKEFTGAVKLNETGLLLFKALREEQTPETLVDVMVENYEVDREKAMGDIMGFIEKLRTAGLIEE